MDRTLTWTIDRTNGNSRVVLSGELTENANLSDLAAQLSGATSLDLAGITRINSPGVREWITFVNGLTARELRFDLERCSVPFVNQLNMISNFKGRGDVRSVFAPYYCPACSTDATRLIDLSQGPRAQIDAPLPCPRCKEPMEFDDMPDAFLSFVG